MEVSDEITLLEFCTTVADELVTGLVFADKVDLTKLTQYKKGALKLKADHPWATRLIHCLDVHFRAATKWRTFQDELTEIDKVAKNTNSKLKQELTRLENDVTLSGLDQITVELSNICEMKRELVAKISKLYVQSATLPCLQKRHKPLDKPITAYMICSLRTKHVKLNEGEAMTLLDNSDKVLWKLIDNREESVRLRKVDSEKVYSIPSLLVLIPGPTDDAAFKVKHIEDQVRKEFAFISEFIHSKLVTFLQQILQSWHKQFGKRTKDLNKKEKSEIEGILELFINLMKRHWTRVATSGLQAEIKQWKKSVQKGSKVFAGKGNIEMSTHFRQLKKLIESVNNLESIIPLNKELNQVNGDYLVPLIRGEKRLYGDFDESNPSNTKYKRRLEVTYVTKEIERIEEITYIPIDAFGNIPAFRTVTKTTIVDGEELPSEEETHVISSTKSNVTLPTTDSDEEQTGLYSRTGERNEIRRWIDKSERTETHPILKEDENNEQLQQNDAVDDSIIREITTESLPTFNNATSVTLTDRKTKQRVQFLPEIDREYADDDRGVERTIPEGSDIEVDYGNGADQPLIKKRTVVKTTTTTTHKETFSMDKDSVSDGEVAQDPVNLEYSPEDDVSTLLIQDFAMNDDTDSLTHNLMKPSDEEKINLNSGIPEYNNEISAPSVVKIVTKTNTKTEEDASRQAVSHLDDDANKDVTITNSSTFESHIEGDNVDTEFVTTVTTLESQTGHGPSVTTSETKRTISRDSEDRHKNDPSISQKNNAKVIGSDSSHHVKLPTTVATDTISNDRIQKEKDVQTTIDKYGNKITTSTVRTKVVHVGHPINDEREASDRDFANRDDYDSLSSGQTTPTNTDTTSSSQSGLLQDSDEIMSMKPLHLSLDQFGNRILTQKMVVKQEQPFIEKMEVDPTVSGSRGMKSTSSNDSSKPYTNKTTEVTKKNRRPSENNTDNEKTEILPEGNNDNKISDVSKPLDNSDGGGKFEASKTSGDENPHMVSRTVTSSAESMLYGTEKSPSFELKDPNAQSVSMQAGVTQEQPFIDKVGVDPIDSGTDALKSTPSNKSSKPNANKTTEVKRKNGWRPSKNNAENEKKESLPEGNDNKLSDVLKPSDNSEGGGKFETSKSSSDENPHMVSRTVTYSTESMLYGTEHSPSIERQDPNAQSVSMQAGVTQETPLIDKMGVDPIDSGTDALKSTLRNDSSKPNANKTTGDKKKNRRRPSKNNAENERTESLPEGNDNKLLSDVSNPLDNSEGGGKFETNKSSSDENPHMVSRTVTSSVESMLYGTEQSPSFERQDPNAQSVSMQAGVTQETPFIDKMGVDPTDSGTDALKSTPRNDSSKPNANKTTGDKKKNRRRPSENNAENERTESLPEGNDNKLLSDVSNPLDNSEGGGKFETNKSLSDESPHTVSRTVTSSDESMLYGTEHSPSVELKDPNTQSVSMQAGVTQEQPFIDKMGVDPTDSGTDALKSTPSNESSKPNANKTTEVKRKNRRPSKNNAENEKKESLPEGNDNKLSDVSKPLDNSEGGGKFETSKSSSDENPHMVSRTVTSSAESMLYGTEQSPSFERKYPNAQGVSMQAGETQEQPFIDKMGVDPSDSGTDALKSTPSNESCKPNANKTTEGKKKKNRRRPSKNNAENEKDNKLLSDVSNPLDNSEGGGLFEASKLSSEENPQMAARTVTYSTESTLYGTEHSPSFERKDPNAQNIAIKAGVTQEQPFIDKVGVDPSKSGTDALKSTPSNESSKPNANKITEVKRKNSRPSKKNAENEKTESLKEGNDNKLSDVSKPLDNSEGGGKFETSKSSSDDNQHMAARTVTYSTESIPSQTTDNRSNNFQRPSRNQVFSTNDVNDKESDFMPCETIDIESKQYVHQQDTGERERYIHGLDDDENVTNRDKRKQKGKIDKKNTNEEMKGINKLTKDEIPEDNFGKPLFSDETDSSKNISGSGIGENIFPNDGNSNVPSSFQTEANVPSEKNADTELEFHPTMDNDNQTSESPNSEQSDLSINYGQDHGFALSVMAANLPGRQMSQNAVDELISTRITRERIGHPPFTYSTELIQKDIAHPDKHPTNTRIQSQDKHNQSEPNSVKNVIGEGNKATAPMSHVEECDFVIHGRPGYEILSTEVTTFVDRQIISEDQSLKQPANDGGIVHENSPADVRGDNHEDGKNQIQQANSPTSKSPRNTISFDTHGLVQESNALLNNPADDESFNETGYGNVSQKTVVELCAPGQLQMSATSQDDNYPSNSMPTEIRTSANVKEDSDTDNFVQLTSSTRDTATMDSDGLVQPRGTSLSPRDLKDVRKGTNEPKTTDNTDSKIRPYDHPLNELTPGLESVTTRTTKIIKNKHDLYHPKDSCITDSMTPQNVPPSIATYDFGHPMDTNITNSETQVDNQSTHMFPSMMATNSSIGTYEIGNPGDLNVSDSLSCLEDQPHQEELTPGSRNVTPKDTYSVSPQLHQPSSELDPGLRAVDPTKTRITMHTYSLGQPTGLDYPIDPEVNDALTPKKDQPFNDSSPGSGNDTLSYSVGFPKDKNVNDTVSPQMHQPNIELDPGFIDVKTSETKITMHTGQPTDMDYTENNSVTPLDNEYPDSRYIASKATFGLGHPTDTNITDSEMHVDDQSTNRFPQGSKYTTTTSTTQFHHPDSAVEPSFRDVNTTKTRITMHTYGLGQPSDTDNTDSVTPLTNQDPSELATFGLGHPIDTNITDSVTNINDQPTNIIPPGANYTTTTTTNISMGRYGIDHHSDPDVNDSLTPQDIQASNDFTPGSSNVTSRLLYDLGYHKGTNANESLSPQFHLPDSEVEPNIRDVQTTKTMITMHTYGLGQPTDTDNTDFVTPLDNQDPSELAPDPRGIASRDIFSLGHPKDTNISDSVTHITSTTTNIGMGTYGLHQTSDPDVSDSLIYQVEQPSYESSPSSRNVTSRLSYDSEYPKDIDNNGSVTHRLHDPEFRDGNTTKTKITMHTYGLGQPNETENTDNKSLIPLDTQEPSEFAPNWSVNVSKATFGFGHPSDTNITNISKGRYGLDLNNDPDVNDSLTPQDVQPSKDFTPGSSNVTSRLLYDLGYHKGTNANESLSPQFHHPYSELEPSFRDVKTTKTMITMHTYGLGQPTDTDNTDSATPLDNQDPSELAPDPRGIASRDIFGLGHPKDTNITDSVTHVTSTTTNIGLGSYGLHHTSDPDVSDSLIYQVEKPSYESSPSSRNVTSRLSYDSEYPKDTDNNDSVTYRLHDPEFRDDNTTKTTDTNNTDSVTTPNMITMDSFGLGSHIMRDNRYSDDARGSSSDFTSVGTTDKEGEGTLKWSETETGRSVLENVFDRQTDRNAESGEGDNERWKMDGGWSDSRTVYHRYGSRRTGEDAGEKGDNDEFDERMKTDLGWRDTRTNRFARGRENNSYRSGIGSSSQHDDSNNDDERWRTDSGWTDTRTDRFGRGRGNNSYTSGIGSSSQHDDSNNDDERWRTDSGWSDTRSEYRRLGRQDSQTHKGEDKVVVQRQSVLRAGFDGSAQALEVEIVHPDRASPVRHDNWGEEQTIEIGERQEIETAEAEQILQAKGEETRTFYVEAVIDPRSGESISLDDAKEFGILDHQNGEYVNPRTGKRIPIMQAMDEQKIIVTYETKSEKEEPSSSFGIVKVKHLSARPATKYKIHHVIHPYTKRVLSLDEAKDEDIINDEMTIYRNPITGHEIPLMEAIENMSVLADPDDDDPMSPTSPNPDYEQDTEKTYIVNAVVDRLQQRRVSFREATNIGLLDRASGMFRDNVTGETMFVSEAIQRGFMKVKEVDNADDINIDPTNHVVVQRVNLLKKKILNPLKAIRAFRMSKLSTTDEKEESHA